VAQPNTETRAAGACSEPDGASPDMLRALWRTMTEIRCFEERVIKEFAKGDMPGFVHVYIGEEAVAAGVCANLGDSDFITSTHRGHGHCIAKGCSTRDMLCELYGREAGLCRGRGGSMHIADFRRGMLGANAIVGGGIGLAAGGALAAQVLSTGKVAVAFFGDGAANQGILHEVMNLAAIWRLPVIFVCENNGWAESTPAQYSTSGSTIAGRAAGYGIPGVQIDGSDVTAVYSAAAAAVRRARAGEGATLLEARVSRLRGHYVGDPEGYRTRDERRALQAYDPLARLSARLAADSILSNEDMQSIRSGIEARLEKEVQYAKSAPLPAASEVAEYVYA
jgi:acetoin:2,6-dichlorophenolindophenol oxidoreductase subunit alpha